MLKVGIIGSTGYAGSELLRLLEMHPQAEIVRACSKSYAGKRYSDIFRNFSHYDGLMCEEENICEMADLCDVIFLALPHGIASERVSKGVLDKVKVIDLGADFRLKDKAVYESWYEIPHKGETLLNEAVYGLCEINREHIKTARLIANPGCYTTTSILALHPLLKENLIDETSVIIDAKSGVTGAGRGVSIDIHFDEVNESVKAYKIASHRHTPEIEEQLSYSCGTKINLTFTPHLIPMNRGILATCYAKLNDGVSAEAIWAAYTKYYENEYFIRLAKSGVFPETKWVKGSNFCDIGFAVDQRCGRIIVVSATDNLVKGAAGQAVQNMNLIFGIDEKTGLDTIPPFPM